MAKHYFITEYGSFVSDISAPGYVTLPKNTFEQLEKFILVNRAAKTDAPVFMDISVRRSVGKVITAMNYVGVITMKDQTTIEILPKIYGAEKSGVAETKKLFIEMLRALKQAPYKNMQLANLDVEHLNIFEIFVRTFIDEIFQIVKHGVKYGYETVEDNVNCFKGKLLVSKNIIHNAAHKERSFVAFDDYNTNRAENRLLKATLLYLSRKTVSAKNKRDIRTLLNEFVDVEPSVDYKSDFNKVQPDRNMEDYKRALMWCKVFLQGKSFSNFSGSNVMAALLFPMENIFEAYIASRLVKILDKRVYDVTAQDRRYHLFDWPGKSFLIKPDIVIRNKQTGEIFILDTKWKMLRRDKPNYGISQADMYQMYAYQKKYGAQNVRLIYPMGDSSFADKKIVYLSEDGVAVMVEFIDLFHADECFRKISDNLNCQITGKFTGEFTVSGGVHSVWHHEYISYQKYLI